LSKQIIDAHNGEISLNQDSDRKIAGRNIFAFEALNNLLDELERKKSRTVLSDYFSRNNYQKFTYDNWRNSLLLKNKESEMLKRKEYDLAKFNIPIKNDFSSFIDLCFENGKSFDEISSRNFKKPIFHIEFEITLPFKQ